MDHGRTPSFVLEPGYRLRLEGVEKKGQVKLIITVLQETQFVGGVKTRVVEEREFVNDQIAEVSRNFFAICAQTGSVVYFGEDVYMYENGVVVSNKGSWNKTVWGGRFAAARLGNEARNFRTTAGRGNGSGIGNGLGRSHVGGGSFSAARE